MTTMRNWGPCHPSYPQAPKPAEADPTRAALEGLLATLPRCQYHPEDNFLGGYCSKTAIHGTASHQPTHCAEHAALLGRSVVGTRTADWAEEVEAAERALDAGPVEVTIGPMVIDNGWIHGEVRIAGQRVGQVDSHGEYDLLAIVAEALGARVVRK